MKTRIFTIALLLCVGTMAHATVLTVSNHPLGGAEYATLSDAYTAANNGDTLLLQGTDLPYYPHFGGGIRWQKSLTVIGIGFNPDKQRPKKTIIANTQGESQFRIGAGSSGSKFYGVVFSHHVALYNTVDDLAFENCRFNDYFNFNNQNAANFVIRNCVFTNDNVNNIRFGANGTMNGIIRNCVFDGVVLGDGNELVDVIIEHCLFLSTSTSPFSNLWYATISNNIFMNTFPGGTINSDYLNNLSAVSGTFPPNPGSGNTGSDNIENSDPLLINYTSGQLYQGSHDYALQAGSPAIGTASNGSDIGPHGGSSNFSEQGEVLINPIIRSMDILNTTVAPGGTLNVDLRATTPADN